MKLAAWTILYSLAIVANAHNLNQRQHSVFNKRQAPPPPPSNSPSPSPAPAPNAPPPAASSNPASPNQPTPGPGQQTPSSRSGTQTGPTPTSGSISPTGSVNGTAVTTGIPTNTTTNTIPALDTGTTIPALANITYLMPTQSPLPVSDTYAQGATPPVSGAPPLPTPFVFSVGQWPAQDKVPDTNSPEVAAWMKELDGFDIPTFQPTADGSCVGDPAAAADSANRGWWTCGGHTRVTDITACPDKLTWGVSFDDGPSPYSMIILNYLKEKDITSTFFVVGSRVIERPAVLIEEYMAGHEISVHTWSHRPLTSLTNEQIVAELGWTRKAIKTVLGVTPTTMRPPFGDIDDRVRAISLAMGMVPILWTRTADNSQFDTNDWRVAGGQVNGTQSFQTFQNILMNSTKLDTGFIVLQHDLFQITVDLAVGYTLDAAQNFQPSLRLESIGRCNGFPQSNLYLESTTNTTFPFPNHTAAGIDTDGDGSVDTKPGQGSVNSGIANTISIFSLVFVVVAGFSTLL